MLYLSCEKNENKQKEAGFGPFLKKSLNGKNQIMSLLKTGKMAESLIQKLAQMFEEDEDNQCDQIGLLLKGLVKKFSYKK